MKNKQLPFYLITVAFFLGITGPALFSDGMFIDGLLYAGVARNLAQGLGSFWDLHMTNTLYPHFNGHPPLAFGIQSLFFRLFGDGLFVERIYSLLTYVITGWIINRIWRKVTAKEFHSLAWIPLLIWVTIPLITWGSANNLLENTMMIFTALSVFFILKSFKSNRTGYLLTAGFMLFAGLLTKGPVALFPLSFLFWMRIFNQDIGWKRFIIDMLILISGLVLPLLILFLVEPASLQSLKAYYYEQLVKSIDIQTVNSRFYILFRMLKELIPAFGILILTIILTYKSGRKSPISKWSYVFLATGLSGVIPIMVSMKQSGFYIIPALLFLAIAVAVFILPRVSHLVNRLNIQGKGFKIFYVTSFVLLIAAIVISLSQMNHIGRDKKLIKDVYALVEIIPEKTTITIQNEIYTTWYLHGYMNRYAGISLEEQKFSEHQFLLVRKGYEAEILKRYKKLQVDLEFYDLYEKKVENILE